MSSAVPKETHKGRQISDSDERGGILGNDE